jgi:pimeloyl-ACP methyl ester carboxylesterase
MTISAPVVFLSGAGLPSWVWGDVRALAEQGGAPTDVAAYAKGRASLREIVDGVVAALPDDPCHLVAHSIGGTVAAGVLATAPARVAAVTAVCAIVPRAGQSFASSLPSPQRYVMAAMVRLLGTKPPASVLRAQLGAGLPDAVTDRVVAGFEPESRRLYLDKLPASPAPAWPTDSAYLVTTEDPDFPVAQQEAYAAVMGARTSTVPSGHLPMLSHPDLVARAVARAGRLG